MHPPSPKHAFVGLLTLTIALTGTGCGSHSTANPNQASSNSSPGATSSNSTAATNVTLAKAVLTPGEAPAGTSYLKKDSGPQSLTDVFHDSKDAPALRAKLKASGFRGAYRTLFVGTPGLSSLGAAQRSVANFSLVFGTPAAAAKGRTRLDSAIKVTGSATPLPDPHLGTSDTAFKAPLAQLHGSTYYYSWQQGPVVRVLIDAGGTHGTSATTSLALARTIAAHPATNPATATAKSLVLQPTEAPHGTQYVAAKSGPRNASDFGQPSVAADLSKLGLTSAYSALFLSPGLAHPQPGRTSAPTNVVSSQAQAYDNDTDASRAYHVFIDRQRKTLQGHPATLLTDNTLGTERFGFKYVDHKPTGDITGISYYWREHNLVLSISVVGSPTFATDAATRALAKTIDARLR
ncbi:hypothetical protein GCM10027596_36500 [Nocardioides korecus]